jgi:hypothetical protein
LRLTAPGRCSRRAGLRHGPVSVGSRTYAKRADQPDRGAATPGRGTPCLLVRLAVLEAEFSLVDSCRQDGAGPWQVTQIPAGICSPDHVGHSSFGSVHAQPSLQRPMLELPIGWEPSSGLAGGSTCAFRASSRGLEGVRGAEVDDLDLGAFAHRLHAVQHDRAERKAHAALGRVDRRAQSGPPTSSEDSGALGRGSSVTPFRQAPSLTLSSISADCRRGARRRWPFAREP